MARKPKNREPMSIRYDGAQVVFSMIPARAGIVARSMAHGDKSRSEWFDDAVERLDTMAREHAVPLPVQVDNLSRGAFLRGRWQVSATQAVAPSTIAESAATAQAVSEPVKAVASDSELDDVARDAERVLRDALAITAKAETAITAELSVDEAADAAVVTAAAVAMAAERIATATEMARQAQAAATAAGANVVADAAADAAAGVLFMADSTAQGVAEAAATAASTVAASVEPGGEAKAELAALRVAATVTAAAVKKAHETALSAAQVARTVAAAAAQAAVEASTAATTYEAEAASAAQAVQAVASAAARQVALDVEAKESSSSLPTRYAAANRPDQVATDDADAEPELALAVLAERSPAASAHAELPLPRD